VAAAAEDLEDAAGSGRIAATAAPTVLDGATTLLPIAIPAPGPSIQAVRLPAARAIPRPIPRQAPRQARQWVEDAVGSGRIAATAARMALDGATSQLPTATPAPGPSIQAVGLPAARQAPRQLVEDAAGSGRIAATVAPMALDGAT